MVLKVRSQDNSKPWKARSQWLAKSTRGISEMQVMLYLYILLVFFFFLIKEMQKKYHKAYNKNRNTVHYSLSISLAPKTPTLILLDISSFINCHVSKCSYTIISFPFCNSMTKLKHVLILYLASTFIYGTIIQTKEVKFACHSRNSSKHYVPISFPILPPK